MNIEEKREAIASLSGHIGFQCLLEDLEHLVNEAVALTVGAETEPATLKAAKNLQALWKYYQVLKTTPESIRDEFEREQQEVMALNDPFAPPFPEHRQKMLRDIEKETRKAKK